MLEISKNNNKQKNVTFSINNRNNNFIQNKRIIVSKKNKFKQKGNYILENTIGEGAFAKVKLGKHIITGEKVAVKILPKTNKNATNNNNISKIKKEINILRRLHHKNIIQLYEIIESENNLYIVMEYCEGKELFDYIVKRKRLTEREACRYFQQIINGVEYLHLCNITHRDLKPENILLDNKKRIRISDFGLSGITACYNSMLSTPCGTPLYAPPEMLRGEKYDGVYSDIWSCGIILYAMLVGDLPYADSKEKIIYQNIMTHNYYYPETMSDDAVDLIEHMLKINPKERYGFKEIKAHPWFNLVTPKLRPGVIYNIHKMPVDEKILDKIGEMGYDKNLCKKSVLENNFDQYMAIYLLTLKQTIREGIESISDLFSAEYIKYINDYKNWIDTTKINNPLFNDYNVTNIALNDNDLSDENNNILIDNIEALSDSDKHSNIFGNNSDNISNEEKKEYLNIIKKHSNEINNSFNAQDTGNKRSILKNSLMKENKDFSELKRENNNKSFDSSNLSCTLINPDSGPEIKNNNYNLTLNKSKKLSKRKIIKKRKSNRLKKNKGLISLKTDMNQNKKFKKNNNSLYKKVNINEIINKRIFTKENTDKTSPIKAKKNKNKLDNESTSIISPILNVKRINKYIENDKKNKFNKTVNFTLKDSNFKTEKNLLTNNDLLENNIEETEFLDRIFNDNLIDLENDSKLILTPSGHFHDSDNNLNIESKTFFSKDENTNLSINSGNNHNNNSMKIAKKTKPLNHMKELKINTFRNLNNNKKENRLNASTERNLKTKNLKKQKKEKEKENVLLMTETLDINIKEKLKKEIEDDLNKFDNDLKIIDNIENNKFIKFENNINANVNINENIGLFNIQDFADKLIKTTIFKNYLIRNNKKIKNEMEDKFYILEKYKNALGLIEKLKNKIFMDKLSNFNFYTFDQYLNDDDDKIISSTLLKNKKLSAFIKKAKETLFNNSNTINKRTYSKNITFESNNLFNKNNINLKLRSKTPKCQFNNIVMNKTQNYFYRQKYNNNNNYNTLQNSIKADLLNRSIKNKNKLNLNLFQKTSPDNISRKTILSQSIEARNNKKIYLRNSSNNKSINKSVQKRVRLRNYLTENKFSTTNNSIKNFNLDNSNSSFNSIITEEGNENINDSNKKLNIKKVIINNRNKKLLNKNDNSKILKTERILIKKKRKILFNGITNTGNKTIDIITDPKKIRSNTIEKRKSKKNDLSLTPDGKNTIKNKKSFINHSINNRKLKTVKILDNKKTNNNITKSNEIRKTINKIKIKSKCELKELKYNYPIDINCIFLTTYNEIKLKIKKYFKQTKSIINEKENNIKILKNGFNIEINFYTIKDIEINNVYICFKYKGENKIKYKEIINDLLLYLHNNE